MLGPSSSAPEAASGHNATGLDPPLGRGLCPRAGWITFDPTNRTVRGFNLVPVAVGRDIVQVMARTPANMLESMTAEVDLS